MDSARGLSDGRRRALVLAGLWALATGLNLLKPFHLDDTAHLLIAENILRDPLHPLSGMLNWLDTAEPVFVTNQPHLFFYLLAGVIAVFGAGEVALHLFLSLFTALAIWGADRLFRRFLPGQALFLTAALVLGPGFLINQNVMVDMPLLALMVLAVLIVTGERLSAARGAGAFAAFSAALLSKYSAVFLFPALLWGAAVSRRAAVWALLPVLALVGWWLSLDMLFVSYGLEASSPIVASVCRADAVGPSPCDRVVHSPYGSIRLSKNPAGPRLPTAVLGMGYFAYVACWFALYGAGDRRRGGWYLLVLLPVLAGAWESWRLIAVMRDVLGQWCAGCLSVHAVNGLILVLTLGLAPWWRRAESGPPRQRWPGACCFSCIRW